MIDSRELDPNEARQCRSCAENTSAKFEFIIKRHHRSMTTNTFYLCTQCLEKLRAEINDHLQGDL